MKYLAPFLILFVVGCGTLNTPVPETPREKLTAAEISYIGAGSAIEQLVNTGVIVKGSAVALSLKTASVTTNQALILWRAAPENLSYRDAAIASLTALQTALASVSQRSGP